MNKKLESFNQQLRETLRLLEEQERLLANQNNSTEDTGLSHSDRMELRRY